MNKELCKRTEEKLYRYFGCKKRVYSIESEIDALENRKKTIEYDIKHTNVNIDYYQNGVGIKERVQSSSSGVSYAEAEMCKAIGELEKEHVIVTKKILKLKSDIRDIEEFIRSIDDSINQLMEEDRRFIKLMYGDRMKPIQIAMELNIGQATAYRKRGAIIELISNYNNSLFC